MLGFAISVGCQCHEVLEMSRILCKVQLAHVRRPSLVLGRDKLHPNATGTDNVKQTDTRIVYVR
jgi:hypothetical protein